LDDVVADDVDINNADVAGMRRRISRLNLRSSPATTVVACQWRQTGWGGNDNIEGATQSMICVIKRGGNAGREVAIQQTAGAREMVAQ